VEIVVTHDMADFDAFASAVAAQKIYPEATVVLGRRLGPELRGFLALHKDRFRHVRPPDVRAEEVTRVVVVDVRRSSRLSYLPDVRARLLAPDREVEVHVWDHHGSAADDLPADVVHVEPVGSATTLLVEEIRRRELPVDPVEATLFALGIHADTGSLTFATSTARDAHALAWLMARGASLRMLARYLRLPFGAGQRHVLSRLLEATETERFDGVEVAFAVVPLERAVDGLAEVTTEALGLEGHPALFAIFPIGGKRVQVVARSRLASLDVGRVLSSIGGGGHAPAGSAIVKDGEGDGDAVRSRIVEALRADPPRPQRVREIMNAPVDTVGHDVPLRELRDRLDAWRRTGMPVVRDGEMVGIVSRRDVEKAERDGRADLPVSSCMSGRVRTTTPDASLEDALAEMVERDIGRLPVLEEGRLVGIVTRTDLLRVLYPANATVPRTDQSP